MKHPLLTSLLLSALILLTACGGGGSGQSSAPGKAATKTEAKAAKGGDWKAHFGSFAGLSKLEAYPGSETQTFGHSNLQVRFNMKSAITMDDFKTYVQKIWEETGSIAEDGLFATKLVDPQNGYYGKDKQYATFAEYWKNGRLQSWCYTHRGAIRKIMIALSDKNDSIEISLHSVNTGK